MLLTESSLPDVIEYYIPPTMIELSGKRFAVIKGVWFVADESVTFEKLYKRWKKPVRKVEAKPKAAAISVQVKSSDGKREYTVEYKHDSWSCTCPAYGFRHKCKHIDQVKSKKH